MKTSLFRRLALIACACIFSAFAQAASNPAGNQAPAQVVIFRAANIGTGVVLHVWVDGKFVDLVNKGQTYRGSLSAGPHVISVKLTPNLLFLQPTKLNLNVEPGRTYAYTAMLQGDQLILSQ